MENMWLKRLVGMRIVTRDQVELGDLVDIQVDADWRVSWLNIRLHRSVTDAFHIDTPFVMGSREVSIHPRHVREVSDVLELHETLSAIAPFVVVSRETDATNHI